MASGISISDDAGLPSAETISIANKDDTTAVTFTEKLQPQRKQSETEQSELAVGDKNHESGTEGETSMKGSTDPSITSSSPSTNVTTSKQQQTNVVKSPTPSKKPHVLSPLLRFPLRIGITWKKGERLEAMDFSKTWYPSKIVEIDEDEKSVLIHFDGWNSRYDEWVPMNSEKLRPQTRHSERKDKKSKNFPQPCAIQDIYQPGQGVLARWTDCKKYPAKISRLMPDGAFEVLFYDGVTRNVQPINIQPLPEELKSAAENIQIPSTSQAASPGPKSAFKTAFKNIQLELPEGVAKHKEPDAPAVPMKKLSGVEKRNRHMEKSIKKSLAHISGSFKKSPLKAHRLKALKGSSKKMHKKMSSSPSSTSTSSSSPSSATSQMSSMSSSSSSSPSLSTSSSSSSLAAAPPPPPPQQQQLPPLPPPPPSSSSATPDPVVTPSALPGASVVSTSTSSGSLKMVLKIGHSPTSTSGPETEPSIMSPEVILNSPTSTTTLPAVGGVKRVKKRCNTDPANYPRKKRKKKSKEVGLVSKCHKGPPRRRVYSLDLGATPSSLSTGVVMGSPSVSLVPVSSATVTTGAQSTTTAVGGAALLQPYQYFIPSKAFIVEEDHNPYKCPFDECPKEFRKENLLSSHIKHYHDNLVIPSTSTSGTTSSSSALGAAGNAAANALSSSSVAAGAPALQTATAVSRSPSLSGQFSPLPIASPLPSTPLSPPLSHQQPVVPARRRRRKTGSFCSTDSDVSVSSKGRSSSSKRKRHDSEVSLPRQRHDSEISLPRQRHDSEISVTGSPDILSRDLWAVPPSGFRRPLPPADVKLKPHQDLLVEDYGETEEEDVESDLVNCVCQIRETNGLMIQCDVCMCWQHFTCVDTEGTGRPPANYVCLACERPKGVRDGSKYMHDLGWERRGELPTFPFVGETFGKNTERMKRVANESIPLASALMGIKAVLHSTRRQIKISKEEDEAEFQLWQTDWDNWTKPEEDLTLTPPHSVEAAPSPAPSTFMFPPASNSPPLPAGNSGLQHPETSPGRENLPPSSSSSSSSSVSMLPTVSYQDSFRSWLSTAKAAPKKRSSSCTSTSTSFSLPSSSNLVSSTSTVPPSSNLESSSKTLSSSTATTMKTTPHNNSTTTSIISTIDNASAVHHHHIDASSSSSSIPSTTTVVTETSSLSSSSSLVLPPPPSQQQQQQQQEPSQQQTTHQQSNSHQPSPSNTSSTQPQTLAQTSLQQQQQGQQQSTLELSLPPLSLDTDSTTTTTNSHHKSEQQEQEEPGEHQHQQQQMLLSPQLTPPMNHPQAGQHPHHNALAAAAAQTPSSVRSCSRRSLLSSASSAPAMESGGGNHAGNDLDLIRGDLFTPGPAGDAPPPSSSFQLARPTPAQEEELERDSERQQHQQQQQQHNHSNLSLSAPSVEGQQSSSSSSSVSLSSPSVTSSLPNVIMTTTTTSNKTSATGNLDTNSVVVNGDATVGNGSNEEEEENDDDGRCEQTSGGGIRRRTSSSLSEQHNGQGSPGPDPHHHHPHHHQPLRELFIDVNGAGGGGSNDGAAGGGGGGSDVERMNNNDNVDDDDNDTDTAEESVEPYRDCERNLLVHISRTHDQIESQLEDFEKQVEELEALADQSDSNVQPSGENALNDVPALRKSLGKLGRSLGKIQQLSMYR